MISRRTSWFLPASNYTVWFQVQTIIKGAKQLAFLATTITGSEVYYLFGIGAVIFVVGIWLLGTLLEYYHKHRMLARIFIISLIIAAIAWGIHIQNPR